MPTNSLGPGDPVLVCSRANAPCSKRISENGSYPVKQWGVLADDDAVITPLISADLQVETVEFGRIPLAELSKDFAIVRQDIGHEYDRDTCLQRATNLLGVKHEGPLSGFADDFICWCLTGKELLPEKHAGEHLRVPFATGIIKGTHHGIAVSDNWVVHFDEPEEDATSKPLTRRNRILLSTREEFLGGYKGAVISYGNESDASRMAARARALNAWLFQGFGQYRVFLNNCEHFACWCKTRRHRSSQVREIVEGAVLAGTALGFRAVPHATMLALRLIRKFVRGPL